MNDIINKFLLAGDRFMPEMHLKNVIVGNYSACGPFTKYKQRIQKFMDTGVQIIFIRINLIKLVFDMIWHIIILKT